MDGRRIMLHYPTMRDIPTYALYGEIDSDRLHDWLHWETIQSRSSLHDYAIAAHRHEYLFQVLYLAGGSGTALLDGTRFALTPDTVVVVPALSVHSYQFSPDVAGKVVTLLEKDVRALELAFEAPAIIRLGTAGIAAALDRLIEEADRPLARHDIAMRAHISLLLVALHRSTRLQSRRAAPADPARLHANTFRWLVDRNFRQTRRIADYARDMGISQTHLHRICRETLGASPLAIIERRIALEARRQLMFSTLSIKQIAAGLGYDDPPYFSRVITRVLGQPPSALRHRGAALSAAAPPRSAPIA